LQAFKKAAKQGDKAANEGVYTDVNDRDLQPPSTQQAKKSCQPAGFFAVVGFFDGLTAQE